MIELLLAVALLSAPQDTPDRTSTRGVFSDTVDIVSPLTATDLRQSLAASTPGLLLGTSTEALADVVLETPPRLIAEAEAGSRPASTATQAQARYMVVSVTHSEEGLSGMANWREDLLTVKLDATGLAVRRETGEHNGSAVFAFQGGRAERFGQSQGFGGIDFYKSITPASYANVRIRVAPRAVVVPEFDALLDLTATTGTGWEGSGGYRLMRYGRSFDKKNIGVISAGLARYEGAWYLRARFSVIPVDGSVGTSTSLTARRYFGGSDELVEFVISSGREVVTGVDDEVIDIRQSVTGSVRGVYSLSPYVSIVGGASYTRDPGLSRWGLVLGVQTSL